MKLDLVISHDAHRSALRVALPYLLVSGLYIVASDRLIQWITRDTTALTRLQTYKGVGFVLVTAALIYATVYWQVRRMLHSEVAQRQQREQFRRAFEDAMTGMAFVSPDGKFVRVNPVLSQMLDYSAHELEGLSVMDIMHPQDQEMRVTILRKLERGDSRIEPHEYRCLARNGRTIRVLASSTLCRDADGQPLYYVTQMVDVTQRHDAEQKVRQQDMQLMHASRLITLGEMASGLAHDLSQPISTILQYAETSLDMLQKGRTDKIDSITGAMQDVVGQAEHMRQIVTRLRTLAKKHTPEPTRLNVNDVIRETLRLLSHEAERRQTLVTLDLIADLPAVKADPVQFQQLIINLFNNALDALSNTPAALRRVVIRTRIIEHVDPRVCVMVCDSGPGLTDSVRSRIFEPFVTSKPNGLGMGLSICKTIVEAHGGRLWHDTADGMTCFSFDLPSAEVPVCSNNPT